MKAGWSGPDNDKPPCKRHLFFPFSGGFRHSPPDRVFAPQIIFWASLLTPVAPKSSAVCGFLFVTVGQIDSLAALEKWMGFSSQLHEF
jgi:hypothetical protein